MSGPSNQAGEQPISGILRLLAEGVANEIIAEQIEMNSGAASKHPREST